MTGITWSGYSLLIIVFVYSLSNLQVFAKDTTNRNSTNFNYTFGANFDDNIVNWQSHITRNITILSGEVGGIVSWTVSDPSVLELRSEMKIEIRIDETTALPVDALVVIGGRYPGRKYLIVTYKPPNGVLSEVGRDEVVCIVDQGFLNDIASYVFIGWLVISYITMGCKMNVNIIYNKLKPPSAIIIGMFCQFIIMPALSFGLARIFELEPATAIGLILVGTCPGGWISNILTVLFDCDFILSLTMTAFSTIIAMGMMPLNLFIYVQVISDADKNLETPFAQLVVQLLLLVAPLGVGVLLAYKWPSLHDRAEKLLKPFATILVLIAVGFGIPTQIYVFFTDWKGWTVSLLLPFFGAFFGLAIARIIAQDYKTSITIAFETACQNALLAKTIANLFYSKPESDLIGILPLLVAVLTAIEGLFAAMIYIFIKKCREKRNQNRETSEDTVNMTNFDKTLNKVNGTNSKEKEIENVDGKDNLAFSA